MTTDPCAILAIASTTQTVHALLQRLVRDVEQASTVPWTIANKYYTAEVKFLVHPLSSWDAIQHELLAPALLFVWNRGEPYRDQIHALSGQASRHDFEVALAVRLPPIDSALPEEIEDDQYVDAFLSSKGFEFIDVTDVETDRSGIPGISRIVDALSTIMWPSMIRTPKRITNSGAAQSQLGMSSDDYHNLVRLVGERIAGNDDRMQQELEELERWLDQDTQSGDLSAGTEDDVVPWSTVVTPGTLSPSLSGFLDTSRPTTPKAGFDDDFTCFVSASPAGSTDIPRASSEALSSLPRFPPLAAASFGSTFSFGSASSGRSTPIFDDPTDLDTTRLAPGESYKSLGSVSDFGDPDKGLEIAESSRRTFGAVPLSLSPTQERGDGALQPQATLGGAPSQPCLAEDMEDIEMTDADLERFDLQSVLGALQGLKEEIAAMPDKERRKAAARVALGLVYGYDDNVNSRVDEEHL